MSQLDQPVGPLMVRSARPPATMAGAPFGGCVGPAQVLLVTDQPVLAELIQRTLNHGRFASTSVGTTLAATEALARQVPHLVLLDLDMEALAGARLLERMGYPQRRLARLPFIALTRRRDLKTTLAAFALGVDDFVTVPFTPAELLARCLAVLRRLYQAAVVLAPTVRVGELEIDAMNRRAWIGTAELHLSPLELHLLYFLAANAGRVLTREEILDHLWGTDYIAVSNVVDRHIHNLRTRLRDEWRHPRFLVTVPGHGYRLLPAAPAEASSLRRATPEGDAA